AAAAGGAFAAAVLDRPAPGKDRWDLARPFRGLAESKPVNDLIEFVEKLEAKPGTGLLDRLALQAVTGPLGDADLRAFGLDPADPARPPTAVRLTVEPPSAPAVTSTVLIG